MYSSTHGPRLELGRRSIVGLSIDSGAVRAAEVVVEDGRARCSKALELELPPGALEDGEVVDADAMVSVLRQLRRSGRFRSRRTVIGLDDRSIFVRRTTVPAAAALNLESAVRYDVGELLPFDLDHALVSFSEIHRNEFEDDDEADTIDVLAVATDGRHVSALVDVVSRAGWHPVGVGPAVTGLIHGLEPPAEHTTALVDLVDPVTSILIMEEGRVAFVRGVPGPTADAGQLAEELEAQLSSISSFRGEQGPDVAMPEVTNRGDHRIATSVARSIDYHQGEQGSSPVTKIVLSGERATEGPVQRHLEQVTGVPVGTAPLRWTPSPSVDAHLHLDSVGVGLAHLDPVPGVPVFDLHSPKYHLRRRGRHQLAIGGLVAGLALVALAGPYLSVKDQSADLEAEAQSLRSTASLLIPDLEALDRIHQLTRRTESADRLRSDLTTGELHWDRLVFELAEAMPTDAFLTQMSFTTGGAQEARFSGVGDGVGTARFSGIAADQATVADWLAAIEALDPYADVWLVQSGGGQLGDPGLDVVLFSAEAIIAEDGVAPERSPS
ncbi:MAG: pilus assembly protein PilM [Actinomycetia bacterium]|nr:pilus assembly protein PilM [Actinomycetes bacterium]